MPPVKNTKKADRRPSLYSPNTAFTPVVPTRTLEQITINHTEPNTTPATTPAPTVPVAITSVVSNIFKPITPRGGKTRKCKNPATYVWLNLWFKSEFEKLGWMVLAKKEGYDDKVTAYKNSVYRLYNQLECKIRDTKDHDRKKDLIIMHKNVKCLIEHIRKDF